MNDWPRIPPDLADHMQVRIIRTPATGKISGVVTSTESVSRATHFIGNRTIPCPGTDVCPHCRYGHNYQWHAYLSVFFLKGHGHHIFELTPAGIKQFDDYFALHKTLRCCAFEATRPQQYPRGRVVIRILKPIDDTPKLPQPFDVKTILCRMWGINAEDTTVRTNPDTGRTVIVPARDPKTHLYDTPPDGRVSDAG